MARGSDIRTSSDGLPVHAAVPSFDDLRQACEVVLSGTMSQAMPAAALDDRRRPAGPPPRRAREPCRERAAMGG
jgi:branched-subunit amino acid aminotransferase/4-amino-4-deoxychorismate lyase